MATQMVASDRLEDDGTVIGSRELAGRCYFSLVGKMKKERVFLHPWFIPFSVLAGGMQAHFEHTSCEQTYA